MSHDDFAAEPINGLPELPPRGEVILWQGRPNWFQLTVDSLNLWWVVAYFAVLTAWRFITVIDVFSFERAIIMTLPFVIMIYPSARDGLHNYKPSRRDAHRRSIKCDIKPSLYTD